MLILVIDDDAAVRNSLRMTLEYDGYVVIDAATGRDGLALAERETPDLVLLDLEMPDMCGFEVLQGLRRAHDSLPVVMMSAGSAGTIAIESKRGGAVDLLEKPFESAARLRTVIEKAMGSAGDPIPIRFIRLPLPDDAMTTQ